MLLNVHNLKCHYGEKLLLDDVSFSIEKGDKIGLIGVNGTGKSTLLSIIAFQKDPESGDCEKMLKLVICPKNLRLMKIKLLCSLYQK